MTANSPLDIAGKTILVLGGCPSEPIDGVRLFSNHARCRFHGARVADALCDLGATVTLVSPKQASDRQRPRFRLVDSTMGNRIVSAGEMAEACRVLANDHFDAILQLSVQSSIVAVSPCGRKIKSKSKASDRLEIETTPNVDLLGALRTIFPQADVLGYDMGQQWREHGNNSINPVLRSISDAYLYPHQGSESGQGDRLSTDKRTLQGRRIVVTSGPTREPVSASGDVLTNFSSGRQGHAVAQALAEEGADVVLVSGPTVLPDPGGVITINVSTAAEMHDIVAGLLPFDAFVGVAAVGDFRTESLLEANATTGHKTTLFLVQNLDILRMVGTHPTLRPAAVVGFAAETHDLLDYARRKLFSKNADFICANPVGDAAANRNSQSNKVTVVSRDGNMDIPEGPKSVIGKTIARLIAFRLNQGNLSP